jgi:large subunit ribosomal protein L4
MNLQVAVLSSDGKEVEKMALDPDIFDGKINHSLMHQAVVIYLANQRKGLANTKTRGEVSGGGRKPWKQKGTGRARSGSTRSPIWRGGGITFGPKPHSFVKDFPQKMKAVALKSALNSKLKDNEILVLADLGIDKPKTKLVVNLREKLTLAQDRVLFLVDKLDDKLKLAVRNLPYVSAQNIKDFNTYNALSSKKLVFTKDALVQVQERIKKVLQ